MKFSPALLLLPLAAACNAQPPADHPVLGTWTFQVPGTGCKETYLFKPDGTETFVSGEEVGESTYEISPRPGPDGAFRLVERIRSTNGRPDCMGKVTPRGRTIESLLRFAGEDHVFLCFDARGDTCVGPFVRMPEQPA